MKRNAFSFIELLVVISIIAVLAAVLFPVFTRSREKAKQTACNSNLRQLGVAMRLYLDDNDGRYPKAWDNSCCEPWANLPGNVSPFPPQPHQAAITVVLEPYVSTPEIWHCPSDSGELDDNVPGGFNHRTPPYYSWIGSSYN
jgi:general secretion pathway protein G